MRTSGMAGQNRVLLLSRAFCSVVPPDRVAADRLCADAAAYDGLHGTRCPPGDEHGVGYATSLAIPEAGNVSLLTSPQLTTGSSDR